MQWHQHKGEVLDKVREFDVIDCESCRFSHIVPIPTGHELETMYREDYYSREWPDYIDRHREDLDWWNLRYDDQYSLFEELIPPETRRILDVGSGPGFFLLKGHQRGWETVGVEPSVQAVEHSRGLGLEIIEGFLDEGLVNQLGQFDVVHMNEVLEHLPDPGEMLRRTYRLLRPGGILCVIVPNDYNPLQQALRSACEYQPWWLAPPHHINYFNFSSLAYLVNNLGFEMIQKTATFPMELFLLMGDNYIGNDKVGRVMHGKRKKLEMNLGKAGCSTLWQKFSNSLADVGVGREVILYARRPFDE
jgi:SAM-dependent methyltransferase